MPSKANWEKAITTYSCSSSVYHCYFWLPLFISWYKCISQTRSCKTEWILFCLFTMSLWFNSGLFFQLLSVGDSSSFQPSWHNRVLSCFWLLRLYRKRIVTGRQVEGPVYYYWNHPIFITWIFKVTQFLHEIPFLLPSTSSMMPFHNLCISSVPLMLQLLMKMLRLAGPRLPPWGTTHSAAPPPPPLSHWLV